MAQCFARLLFIQTPAPEVLEHRLGKDYVFLSPLVVDKRDGDKDFDHQAAMKIDHSLDEPLGREPLMDSGWSRGAFLGARTHISLRSLRALGEIRPQRPFRASRFTADMGIDQRKMNHENTKERKLERDNIDCLVLSSKGQSSLDTIRSANSISISTFLNREKQGRRSKFPSVFSVPACSNKFIYDYPFNNSCILLGPGAWSRFFWKIVTFMSPKTKGMSILSIEGSNCFLAFVNLFGACQFIEAAGCLRPLHRNGSERGGEDERGPRGACVSTTRCRGTIWTGPAARRPVAHGQRPKIEEFLHRQENLNAEQIIAILGVDQGIAGMRGSAYRRNLSATSPGPDCCLGGTPSSW